MRPNILVIAGHDPSGGAGIHADIEAVHSLGGFAATLITGLTVQNSQDVRGFELVSRPLLEQQAQCLLEDMDFQAVKIGMTGSPEIIDFIAGLLDRLPNVPVVLDPVLAAEAGGSLSGETVPGALLEKLFARASLVTPNLPEAEQLSGKNGPEKAGQWLLQTGCPAVLVTGSHDQTPQVHNHLFLNDDARVWQWPRLKGSFHGSGCTLASACAALLARGLEMVPALEQAQQYVDAGLRHAWQPGSGQRVPDRGRHE